MAQWTTIDPNTLLPGDPWTSAKAQAAFENVEAMAEGAPGAPRVQGKALGGLRLPAFSATGNSWAGLTDLGDFSEIFFTGFTRTGAEPQSFQVRFSTNNGSTWGSSQNLFVMSLSAELPASLHLNLVSGDYSAVYGRSSTNSSVTVPANVNALQLRTPVPSDFGFAMTAMVTGGRGGIE